MRILGFTGVVLFMVEAVRGQVWPPRPWIRLVLSIGGRAPYNTNTGVTERAQKFLEAMMNSGEPNEEEAFAFWANCRATLLAFLEHVLPIAGQNGGVIDAKVAREAMKRVIDGSFDDGLHVPYKATALYRFLTAKVFNASAVPLSFQMHDKGMELVGWLRFVQALLKKEPFSRDAKAIQMAERYEGALIKCPQKSEADALVGDAATRRLLVEVVHYIFQQEKVKTVWYYSATFVKSLLQKILDGSFETMLSEHSGVHSLLAYASGGQVPPESTEPRGGAVGGLPQSHTVVMAVSCVVPVVLWWADVPHM